MANKKVGVMNIFREMTLPMAVVAGYSSLGGMAFGIDYNYWSGMLGMETFINNFGVYNSSTDSYSLPPSWQSAGSGLPIAGLAMGATVAGLIGNYLGRLRTFQVSSVISIVGVLIQSAAISSYWQLMVGRFVNSLALGVLANTVPAYLAETAPSSIRGTLVNCYQFSLGVGAVLVATINWGMHERTDQWAFRMVIILQFICPIILITGSFFIPESPRWLIGKGRNEEAIRALQILRKGVPHDVIEQEANLISAAEEDNRTQFQNSWIECFRGSNLRRTLIVTGVQCLQQAQGNSFMSSYSVVFLQTIGVENVYTVIVLIYFVFCISGGFAFYFPDRIGRRPLMIVCSAVMTICMYIVAGITGFGLSENPNAVKGALGVLFIWWFFSALGWSSCVWIITAEVPTLQLREKTIMIGTVCGFTVSVLVTFINPYMQDEGYGALEGRIGFVYGSFSLLAVFWCLFLLPETAKRSLEELDEMFAASVSTWKFGKYKTTGFGAQLTEVEHEIIEGVEGDAEKVMVNAKVEKN